jgi:acetyl-CoA carboxylase carboxyltransferase component
MAVLYSNVNPADPQFQANADHHRALANQLRERLAQVRQGGGARYRQRHEAQGKLFVRERIDRLLDPGSPFLEMAPFAAWGMYDD